MSALYQYALLRAVPRAERGECINVGVVLYSQELAFLDARSHLEPERLRCLAADIDLEAVAESLDAVCRAVRGEGPAGQTPLGVRFGWVTAPRSTLVRAGAIHTGKTSDPAAELDRLHRSLVR